MPWSLSYLTVISVVKLAAAYMYGPFMASGLYG